MRVLQFIFRERIPLRQWLMLHVDLLLNMLADSLRIMFNFYMVKIISDISGPHIRGQGGGGY